MNRRRLSLTLELKILIKLLMMVAWKTVKTLAANKSAESFLISDYI